MNDERLGQEISDFYRQTDVMPPDSKGSAREVAARLPQVEQVQRRRRLPTWLTRATHEVGPIQATNGHTPTVIGRTSSMLSPAKAIAAGAIVFALGGMLLIAQPFDQQGGSVPGAATDAMDPATFTAEAILRGRYGESATGATDGVVHFRADFQMTVDATDPRASGTLTYGLNRDSHSGVRVQAGTVTIENDDGMWAGTFTGYWAEDGDRIFHAQLAGQGGYEGWTMLLDDVCECSTPTSVSQGVIIPGDLPAAE